MMIQKELILGTSHLARLSQRSVNRFIDYACNLGIQEFDTAPLYGLALVEKRLGVAIKLGQLRINTKFGLSHYRSPSRNSFDMRVKYTINKIQKRSVIRNFDVASGMRMVENSLRRLNIDRIHIYFLHDVLPDELNRNLFEDFFGYLKQKELIQFAGISTHLKMFDNQEISRLKFIDHFQIYYSDFENVQISKLKIYSVHSLFRDRVDNEDIWKNFDVAMRTKNIRKIVVGTSNKRHLSEIVARFDKSNG